jgi:CheY-like chemotaxis protein
MKGHCILLVSQRTYFREALGEVLASDGHTVEMASDPTKALEHIRHGYFDLIVTDLTLPDMDGIELVANMQDLQPGIRSVLLVSSFPKERRERLRRMGFLEVLSPQNAAQAQQWIQQVLHRME